jgi:hypothetical protein
MSCGSSPRTTCNARPNGVLNRPNWEGAVVEHASRGLTPNRAYSFVPDVSPIRSYKTKGDQL